MIGKLFSVLIIAVVAGGTLAAEDGDMTRSEKRLARLHEEYQPTGNTRSCVSLHRLRDSIIIDDQTIFFRGSGKTAYVNRLPHKCNRLMAEERFSYSVSIGQLCRHELITVLDSFGQSWNRCGLGEFEEWEKKTDSPDEPEDQATEE